MSQYQIPDKEPEILDEIRIAHDIRRMLWEEWGERTVPHLWVVDDEAGLTVRGTDREYRVIITPRES